MLASEVYVRANPISMWRALHCDYNHLRELCRRVVCEWLQGEASSKGLAAIAASGAGAAVEAAAASERLEVIHRPLFLSMSPRYI